MHDRVDHHSIDSKAAYERAKDRAHESERCFVDEEKWEDREFVATEWTEGGEVIQDEVSLEELSWRRFISMPGDLPNEVRIRAYCRLASKKSLEEDVLLQLGRDTMP